MGHVPVFCLFYLLILILTESTSGFLEPGKWSFSVKQKSCHFFQVHKALYQGSVISIRILCDPSMRDKGLKVKLGWVVRQTPCYEEYMGPEVSMPDYLNLYYNCPAKQLGDFGYKDVVFFKRPEKEYTCDHLIDAAIYGVDKDFRRESIHSNETRVCQDREARICDSSPSPPLSFMTRSSDQRNMDDPIVQLSKRSPVTSASVSNSNNSIVTFSPEDLNADHQTRVPSDGVYLFILKITSPDSNVYFDASVDIEIKSQQNGYLSAVEYPLLPFYGVMCIVYVLFASGWLIVSFLQWRDLLRIQFWVGAVILLGMIEKAVFYAEHQSLNSTGHSVRGAVLFAEIISCLKRTLARMLVIVVSLGFGIVKPRLGSKLHMVVGVGGLYFCLGSLESILRVYRPKNDPGNQTLLAGVPLAILDSVICWWVLSSLVKTTRTLKMRRNAVKLNLYRQFTNTLMFAVLASIGYMIWQIHSHKLTSCLYDWHKLWMDEAFWHLEFSAVLLVIMILWRPTQNNQRYAFTPLLDASDDDENDVEFIFTPDAYAGMKMRGQSESSLKEHLLTKETEEDLKWVQENISDTLVDVALPSIMDSDEEILTAKIERNKME